MFTIIIIMNIHTHFVHLHFVHFLVPMVISPMGNSVRFPQGTPWYDLRGWLDVKNNDLIPQGKPAATESRYPALINYQEQAESFYASIIHRNSDMVYRIFNMRTWSFLCVSVGLHTGIGHTDTSQHNIFDSEKLSQFFLCSRRRRGSNLGSDALPTEPPRCP